jgi:hypothetical protein
MVYDIEVHESNPRPYRDLKFLNDISFKKCVFFSFLNNKCIIISSFKKKNTTISKRRRFYKWALHYFFNFILFANVS